MKSDLFFSLSCFQIRKLEEKLTQTQAAKDELEAGQNAIKGMIKQLEDSKNMEAEERARLEDEIRVKQHEVQFISDQVSSRVKNCDHRNSLKRFIKFLGSEKRRGEYGPSESNGRG
jgi:hypothetical protein